MPALRQVLKEKRNQIYERNLLILIATDGIPTDERERTDIRTLEQVLRNERNPANRIPVTFIICTGKTFLLFSLKSDLLLFLPEDKQSMAYLNDWDKKIPNLDVVDDYRTERQQIQSLRGNTIPFSYGDVSSPFTLLHLIPIHSIHSTSSKFSWVVSIVHSMHGMKTTAHNVHSNKYNLFLLFFKIHTFLSMIDFIVHNIYKYCDVDDCHLVVLVENQLDMTNRIHGDI